MTNEENTPKDIAEKRPAADPNDVRKAAKDTVPEGQGFYAPREPSGGAIPASNKDSTQAPATPPE